MPTILQFKRYANTVVANTAGADGELIIDETNHTVTVHDGVTYGGTRLATETYVVNQVQTINNLANTEFYLTQYAANTANLSSANTIYLSGVNATQNANIALLFAIDAYQNTISQIQTANIAAAFNQANTSANLAQAAYNASNSANSLALTAFNRANTVNGAIYITNSVLTSVNNSDFQFTTNGQNFFMRATGSLQLPGTISFVDSTVQSTAFSSAVYNTINSAFTQANTAATIVPQNAQSANYTLANTDAGKHLYYTNGSAVNLYIPWTSNTTYANGTTITIISHTSSNVTVTPNTGVTMYLAGNTTSASRNVTTYGMATLIMTAANTWYINGTGVF